MRTKRAFSLSRCYGIFFLAVTLMLGCLFILQTADIYFSAMEKQEAVRAQAGREGWDAVKTAVEVAKIPIYSRAIAGQHLAKLLPYVCIWLAALVGAIAVAARCPREKARVGDPDAMLWQKLHSSLRRLPAVARPGHEEDLAFALAKQRQLRRQRRLLMGGMAALTVVTMVLPVVYFSTFSHFPSEHINAEVSAAVLYALPFLLVLLAGSVAFLYVQQRGMKLELAAAKAAIAAGEKVSPAPAKKCPAKLIVRICLLVAGVGLFILGTQNGSMQEVFIKATKICTECIGLG